MKSEEETRQIAHKALMDLVQVAMKAQTNLLKRCMMEGCRYGYTKDKIQDTCIYCGVPLYDPYPEDRKVYTDLYSKA